MRRLMMCSLLFGLSTAVAVAGPPRFKYTAEVPTAARDNTEPKYAQPATINYSKIVQATVVGSEPVNWPKVERNLRSRYPKCDISLIPMKTKVIVKGTAGSPKERTEILSAARKHLQGKTLPNPISFEDKLTLKLPKSAPPQVVVLRSTLIEVPNSDWDNFRKKHKGSIFFVGANKGAIVKKEQIVSQWLQDVAKQRGVRVLSSPVVTMVPGHTATIDMQIPQPPTRLRSLLNLPNREPIPFHCRTTVNLPKPGVYNLTVGLNGTKDQLSLSTTVEKGHALIMAHPNSTEDVTRLIVMTPNTHTAGDAVNSATLSMNVVKSRPYKPVSPYAAPPVAYPAVRPVPPPKTKPAGVTSRPVTSLPVAPPAYVAPAPYSPPPVCTVAPAYQPAPPQPQVTKNTPAERPWQPVALPEPPSKTLAPQCPAGTTCPVTPSRVPVVKSWPIQNPWTNQPSGCGILAITPNVKITDSKCPLTGCPAGLAGPLTCPLKDLGVAWGTPIGIRAIHLNTNGEKPACCADGECCCKAANKPCQCVAPSFTITPSGPTWVQNYPVSWSPARTVTAKNLDLWQYTTPSFVNRWSGRIQPLPGHASRIQHLVKAAHHLEQAGRKKEAQELRRQIPKVQQECLEELLKVRRQEVKTIEAELKRVKAQQSKPTSRPSASLKGLNNTFELTFTGKPVEFQRLHRVPAIRPVTEYNCVGPAGCTTVSGAASTPATCRSGSCCSGQSTTTCLSALLRAGFPRNPLSQVIVPVVNWTESKRAQQAKKLKGQTLPSAYYLQDDVQYFPAGTDNELIKQSKTQNEKLGVDVKFDFQTTPSKTKIESETNY